MLISLPCIPPPSFFLKPALLQLRQQFSSTHLDRCIRRNRYPKILYSPTLILDMLPDLPWRPDTVLIDAHPRRYQMSRFDLIVEQDHPSVSPCFFQDIKLETALNVFEIRSSVRECECTKGDRGVSEDVWSAIAIRRVSSHFRSYTSHGEGFRLYTPVD